MTIDAGHGGRYLDFAALWKKHAEVRALTRGRSVSPDSTASRLAAEALAWHARSGRSGHPNRRTPEFPVPSITAGQRAVMQGRARLAWWKITLRRPRAGLHLDPGHCDCRDRAGGGPVPIQPLPGGTQFAQTMLELGRQHRYMGAAPNPRTLTGRFGASSHVLRFPCGLSSGFPFAHPGSSPSSAVPWLPLVRRPPVRSLRPSLSGSVPRRFPSGFPSP